MRSVRAGGLVALAALAAACGGGSGGGPAPLEAPRDLRYALDPAVYTVGVAIPANAPSTGGGAPTSYAVSPSLPAGLSLDAATGVLRGTPSAVAATAAYAVTAANSAGSTTGSLTITVGAALAPPTGLRYPTNPATYTAGSAIPPNVPTSGGGPVATWSVAPALPAGLALDAANGAIRGTPTAASPAAGYTVTAANAAGSTTAVVVLEVVVPTYTVRGTVAGLSGSGLLLRLNGAEGVAVASGGTAFAFSTRFMSGSAYAVTVGTQPSGPTQECQVRDGSGTVGSSDVTGVVVSCTTSQFPLGGTVSGLAGSGLVLQSPGLPDVPVAAGTGGFSFGFQPSGTAYDVTVKSQPASPTQECAVTGGTGVIGDAAPAGLAVSCRTLRSLTTTVTGLSGTLVLAGTLDGAALPTATVTANGTVPGLSRTGLAPETTFAVAVQSQPAGQVCVPSPASGTLAAADVTVTVTCVADPVAVRWAAPATWSTSWSDADAGLVQHATFTASGIRETRLPGAWTWAGSGAPPATLAFTGFPGATRYRGGPFLAEADHYENAAAAVDALTGDMIVCALVKPDFNPPDGSERAIVAKGFTNDTPLVPIVNGGWVLMQMHEQFCFHYASAPQGSQVMVYTPTMLATGSPWDGQGTLDASYLAVCAGRDGNTIRIAVNDVDQTLYTDPARSAQIISEAPVVPGSVLGAATTIPMTIGGYSAAAATGTRRHAFGGRVFETATWSVPATRANLAAKLRAVQGLRPDEAYARNREGPYVGPDGAYHAAGRHAPRIDPVHGYLFGLQGWNRLTSATGPNAYGYFTVTPNGEMLDLWDAAGGAAVVPDVVVPPGDGLVPTADEVTLPSGGSLGVALQRFDQAGPVHAQAWIRPIDNAGTLTVEVTRASGGGTASTTVDLTDASTYPAGQWRRIWLRGLTTDGTATPGRLTLRNLGATTLRFAAWGLAATQIGGGGDLGSFDPGPAMYDWTGPQDPVGGQPTDLDAPGSGTSRFPQDVLEVYPSLPATGATGYCLSVDARMPPGLAWDAPFRASRTALSWTSDASATDSATLFIAGTGASSPRQLCFAVTGSSPGITCGPIPSGFAPGSAHNLKGCVSASGRLRAYADDVQVGSTVTGVRVHDLSAGHLLVGNSVPVAVSTASPWQGYVSAVQACRDPGEAFVPFCRR